MAIGKLGRHIKLHLEKINPVLLTQLTINVISSRHTLYINTFHIGPEIKLLSNLQDLWIGSIYVQVKVRYFIWCVQFWCYIYTTFEPEIMKLH